MTRVSVVDTDELARLREAVEVTREALTEVMLQGCPHKRPCDCDSVDVAIPALAALDALVEPEDSDG